jgi:hypothetical protein
VHDKGPVVEANDMARRAAYVPAMNMRALTPLLAALALVAVPLAAASASAPLSPDQKWVAEMKSARQANQAALRQLAPSISSEKLKKARSEVASAIFHLKKAAQAAAGAIGASDTEIADSLREATTLSAQASKYLRSGSYDAARRGIDLAIDAKDAALAKFGVPLASEFKVVGGYRELANIQGWEEYLGLTAKAPGTAISKVVIGLAGRETANAAEPKGRKGTPSLPITKLAIYTLQEPSGVYRSGWGKLVNGIIVCDLKPTMDKDETFAISFGPRVAAGTKFLVKLWSTDGRRSYAVVTTK